MSKKEKGQKEIKEPKAPKTLKAPKTPKAPKAPKGLKTPKAPKIPKAPKMSGAKKQHAEKTKSEVPFIRSIGARLIAAFMIPVLGIVILGVASYRKSSTALISNYQTSVEQTVDMMQQYISLVVSSEKDEFKSYLTNADMKNYLGGLLDEKDEISNRTDFQSLLRNKMALDSKIRNVFILADSNRTLNEARAQVQGDLYSAYSATTQGAIMASDTSGWHIFGQDPEADAIMGIKTEGYCLRIAKRMNEQKAVMLIDIDASVIRESMKALDGGEGSYVCIVTEDGTEFYSDGELQLEAPMVFGTEFYEAAVASKEQSGNDVVNIGGRQYLFLYSKMTTGNAIVTALIPSARLTAEASQIKTLSVVLVILFVLIASVLALYISRTMINTIKYILRQLRKVSGGDLTVHLTAKTKDEFSLLCDGVNHMVEHVKDLIVHVNEVSNQLNDAASYVNQASGTFLETSQDIQSAVNEIEIGVNKLDTGSEDCLTQMDSLSGKISNVSQNADEIGKLTSETGSTISSGIESVQGLNRSAQSTMEITQRVIAAIEELESKSKSIDKIISAINDIAEQTNLLSLNASIEAARAGEAGRGFAVVAEEIRKLSDQCLTSAGQISSIVTEIVANTAEVVEIARQAESVVSTQADVVEETTESFRRIDRQVQSLLDALGTISNNVDEMNSSRSETLEAIESISAVSAETAACSSTVYTSAGSQLSAVQELEKASVDLAEKSDRLVEMLKSFTI